MYRKVFQANTLHCTSCVRAIEKALTHTGLDISFYVDLSLQQIWISSEKEISADLIKDALSAIGHPVKEIDPNESFSEIKASSSSLILALCIFVTFMLGMWFSINFPPWFLVGLASICQFYCAYPFYKNFFLSLRSMQLNMDALVVLGSSSAYFLSLWELIFNPGAHLYFEASAGIVGFILLGRFIEGRSKRKASQALIALLEEQPKIAFVKQGESFEQISITELKEGDVFRVRPGEKIPCDGLLSEGEGVVNESIVTGESVPVHKTKGMELIGGTINTQGVFFGIAKTSSKGGILQQILEAVRKAQSEKAPIQKLVDRVAAYFVPIVFLIGILVFLIALLSGIDLEASVLRMIAVWLIACPCSLGLATPLVMTCACGAAARLGILFKSGEILEKLAKVKILCFDKTGTLTEGGLAIKELDFSDIEEHSFSSSLLKSLATNSTHPIAQAIEKYIEAPLLALENTKEIVGKGVIASYNGQQYCMGSWKLALEFEPSLGNEPPSSKHIACSRVFLVSNKGLLVTLYLDDPLRKEAVATVEAFHAHSVEAHLLSGDRKELVAYLAKHLGMDYAQGEMLPQEKASHIKNKKQKGFLVGMVGDGMNDAPALAASDIGICLPKGSQVSLETADLSLLKGDLQLIYQAYLLSRRAHIKIRQNLFFALFYNVLGIPLAALGVLTPLFASIAMVLSSLSVVGNSLLLFRETQRRDN